MATSTTASPSSRWWRRPSSMTGTVLQPSQDIYWKRCLRKARSIIKAPTHLSHELFVLSSGRCYRSMRSDTYRLRDSFYLQAIRLLEHLNWPPALTLSLSRSHLNIFPPIPPYPKHV
jgi:hypothetical protein